MRRLKLRALVLPVVAFVAAGCSLALDFEGDCTADGGCASLGEGLVCQNGVCVESIVCPEVLANGCDDIYGPLASDPESTAATRVAAYVAERGDYELIAVHTPRGGFAGAGRAIIEAAVRVAVEDINQNRAFGDIEGNGRKLAALICDDGSDAIDTGLEAARHAVSCGAKVIVATHDSEPTKELYVNVARTANVPIIAPGALSPVFPTVRTNGGIVANDDLLWRVRVPGDIPAKATAAAIKALDRHQRVVVFYRAGAEGELDPNGPKLWEIFRGVICDGPFCTAGRLTGYAFSQPPNELRAEIVEFLAEHGDFDLVVTLIPDLNDLLAVLAGATVAASAADLAPEVIQVEGARSAQAPFIYRPTVEAVGVSSEDGLSMLCRMVGISSASNGSAYAQWLPLFKSQGTQYLQLASGETFESKLVAPTPAYFDAVTIAAFAMAAAALNSPDGQIDTLGIIGGLKRLSDTNKATTVGPFEWRAGLTELRTRGPGNQSPTMNYEGASGPIDFIQTTGDVRNELTDLWQYSLAGQATAPSEFGVRTMQNRLTTDTATEPDLSVLEILDRMMADPVCATHPYPLLVTPEMSGDGI